MQFGALRGTVAFMSPSQSVEAVASGSALVRQALRLARELHGGEYRPVGAYEPFVAHLEAVAELLIERGAGERAVAAGLLHDALEHTDVGQRELRQRCGADVAATVVAVSADRRIESHRERRRAVRERVAAAGPDARRVFAAEKIANVIALRECKMSWDPELEAEMEIGIPAQIDAWEADMAMLFDLDEDEPLAHRLADELLLLHGAGGDVLPLCSGFVARAGVRALLEMCSLEKRAVLRERLAEASDWQQLSEREVAPVEEEDDEDDWDEDEDEDEDHEFSLAVEALLQADPSGEEPELEFQPKFVLSKAGYEMLLASRAVHRWLGARFGPPVEPFAERAQAALHAVAFGWASTVVHALAPGPLTVAELQRAVGELPADVLRRSLAEMETNGLVTGRPWGSETRYEVTEALREAAALLSAFWWYELRRPTSRVAAPDELDVTTALLLAMPLLRLPGSLAGSCRLGIELGGSDRPRLAGVTVRVEDRRVAAAEPTLDGPADAWAVGSTVGWVGTMIDPGTDRIRTGGDDALAAAILDALRERLYAGTARR